MSYYFYLGGTMLPVAPPSINTEINGKNQTINLINEGEANIIKTTGLTNVSFSFLLPNQQYPFASYDTSLQNGLIEYALGEVSQRLGAGGLLGNSFSYKPAKTFLNAVKAAKEKIIPMRFIVTRMSGAYKSLWHTNMLCSIENYSIKESHSYGYDVQVDISLKEYKPFGTKEVEVVKDENGKETLRVKTPRYSPDPTLPAAMKATSEMSTLEAVTKWTHGGGDWRSVMNASGISNPCEDIRGKVLHFV